MFDFVRAHTRLFQGILVLLVFPSFVFFGVQGYSSLQDASMKDVAKVDGRGITQVEWDQAHQRSVDRVRRQAPNVDAKLLDSPELKQQTLDALVRERVLLVAAQKQHLLPSDERLQRLFMADPQFEGMRKPDGSVNRELLQLQGMSSEAFAQQLRLEFGMRQVLGGIGNSTIAPKASVVTALDALFQRREVQMQRFDPKDYAAKINPTEAELETYFKANEARFRLPEKAQIEYVVLDVETLKKSLTVSDTDLRKFYDDNGARWATPEERRVSHILVQADKDASADVRSKAKARAEGLLADVRKTPAAFAELARKNSQDPLSAEKGGDLDFAGREGMASKAFADAVYALKPGETGAVVETEFGYHVVKLTAVRGGDKKAFDVVRAEIDAELRREQAQRKFAESAEVFTNTVYEQSESLQPVIDKLKLEKRSAEVLRAPAPAASGALASVKLLDAVFGNDAVKNKRNTEAVDIGGSQLASARIVKHTPASTPPLADVKERVRDAVVQAQAAALARKEGQARLAQLKAAPGDAAGLPAAVLVSRAQPQSLPRPVLEAVLQAHPDKLPAAVGVDLGEQGFAVARIGKILPRDEAVAPVAMLSAQYAQAWGGAETTAYFEVLKKRHKVDVKPAAAQAASAAAASAAGR